MRTIETKIYHFDELTDTAKEKAVECIRQLSYDDEWWQQTYDDAENVDMKITHFDTGRAWDIGLKFNSSAYETAMKIVAEHGEMCETYKTAKAFITEWDASVVKHSDGINLDQVDDDKADEFDEEADELETEFTYSLGHDYLIMLRNDEGYIYSDEGIKGQIECNDTWEFTEEGKLI